MDRSLPKFDIYQGTRVRNCFKSHKNSWYPHLFQGKVLSIVRSEIHLVWRNIISTGQSVSAYKNYIQVWGNHMSLAEMNRSRWCYHWRIFRSSYRKLVWVRFEPTTTEFRSGVKLTELSGHHIYIYIYIYIYIQIYQWVT